MGKSYMYAVTRCCVWLAILWMLTWNADLIRAVKTKKICPSLDVRNFIENFKVLENCSIIEGSLQILLIHGATPNDYKNLSFPDLIEIKDYLLLYHVDGLQSIGKLFPNLAVIRGERLFYNYAFVVYEMNFLKAIGLNNMVDILRGSVRIEKNHDLCYINTVDWDLIAHSGKGGHFMKDNKNVDECPDVCLHDGKKNLCPYHEKLESHLCWNRYYCQKVCSEECEDRQRSCAQPSGCCHSQCLSGCTGSESVDCIACKHVLYEGRCLNNCPSSLFQYNSRCITEEECRSLPPDGSRGTKVYYKPWKLERRAGSGKCSLWCPRGFTSKGRHSCQKCERYCPKVCLGMKVSNVAMAQRLSGCTEIQGSLTIQINGGGTNIVKELEKHLGLIETVTGYVKVVRSLPLLSLDFLRNLSLIKGEELDRKASFLVYDNQNLQNLWDWSIRKRQLTVRTGKPLFHYNPKLCLGAIERTLKIVGYKKWDNIDVSDTSNGNKGACGRILLNLSVKDVTAGTAKLVFDNYRRDLAEQRTVLGYVISYRRVDADQEVSIFDDRDACSDGDWSVEDVEATDSKDRYLEYVVFNLIPSKRYAAHVRTYVIDSEKNSAHSRVVYFTTKPTNPSRPVDLTAYRVAEDNMLLRWKRPFKPNGIVAFYKVTWREEIDDEDEISQKNYCADLPLQKKPKKAAEEAKPFAADPSNRTSSNGHCQCAKTKDKVDEDKILQQIDFENYIHNVVYVKKEKLTYRRKKRSVIDKKNGITGRTNGRLLSTAATTNVLNMTTPVPIIVRTNTSKDTLISIFKLRHYTEYLITVQACHNYDHAANITRCSIHATLYQRSKPLGGADDIDLKTVRVKVDNHTSGIVYVKWEPPVSPNGMTVGHQVEYRRSDIENFKPITVCITNDKFKVEKGHSLKGLSAGKYAMRLQSLSMVGTGNWTKEINFEIIDDQSGLSTAMTIIVSVVVATVLLIVVVCTFGWYYVKKKYAAHLAANSLFTSVNPEYLSTLDVYIPDEWELLREYITITRELGQGSFGMVYEGINKDPETNEEVKVAIKTVNESCSIREFLNEASVMKAFKCHHVVRLRGVVSVGQPTLVIMELMENGDMKSYLRSQRPDYQDASKKSLSVPTLKRFSQMSAEIADGMDYLTSKKFVHRDLAARNCMVAADLTIKIGDFGMTRDIYETDYYRKGGKGLLPVRWMAPESLKDGVFTSQSDVWSYGIVLWEMVTLASQPYQGLANEQVLKYVIDGGLMEEPESCPDVLYEIMHSCWSYDPKQRPTFSGIVEKLISDISDDFKKVSFYFNKNYNSCNKTETAEDDDDEDDEESATPSTPLRINGSKDKPVIVSSGSKTQINKPPDGRRQGTASSTTANDGSKSSKTSNHSSNGYVPCDVTGSTVC